MLTANPLAIRRKILGIALRQTRLARRRTPQDLADLLQCSVEQIAEIERGVRDLSLPDLEVVADYLQVSVSDLVAGQGAAPTAPTSPQARLLRDKVIGASLRKARAEAGRSLEEVSQLMGYSVEQFASYERGLQSMPALELEQLAAHLGLPFPSLTPAPAAEPEPEPRSVAAAVEDPEMLTFVSAADSLPYLRLALEISRLPAAGRRAIAVALLAAAQDGPAEA